MADVRSRQQAEAAKMAGYWSGIRASVKRKYGYTGPLKAQIRSPGDGWQVVGKTAAGTPVWGKLTAAQAAGPQTSGPPGGGGYSGGGGSGGGGGGGGGSPGLSSYIQRYRLMFGDSKVSPPEDLLKAAKDGNWSIAYWDMRVRESDPRYFRSQEARNLLLNKFNPTMKSLFPGLVGRKNLMNSPFYRKIALEYLKKGWGTISGGEQFLYQRITGTKRWNKMNPYWKDYAGNRNIGVQAQGNPILYKQYLEAVRTAFKEYGMEMPDDYLKAFFRSRYAAKQNFSGLTENLKLLSQTKPSMEWFQGKELSGEENKSLLFGGKDQSALRTRLSRAFGTRTSYLEGEQRPFETSVSEQNKLLKPLL